MKCEHDLARRRLPLGPECGAKRRETRNRADTKPFTQHQSFSFGGILSTSALLTGHATRLVACGRQPVKARDKQFTFSRRELRQPILNMGRGQRCAAFRLSCVAAFRSSVPKLRAGSVRVPFFIVRIKNGALRVWEEQVGRGVTELCLGTTVWRMRR